MNPKQFQNSAISCNCFAGPYQSQSNPAFVINYKNSGYLTSAWQQKILTKLAKNQGQQQYPDSSILQKLAKKSLKRDVDRSTLEASKKLPEFKTIEKAESVDMIKSNKKAVQIEKCDYFRQQGYHNNTINSLTQNKPFSQNHILSISKHKLTNGNEIPSYIGTLQGSSNHRMNSMSGNFNYLVAQTPNNYKLKITHALVNQQQQSCLNQTKNPFIKCSKNKQQHSKLVKKVSLNQQSQLQESLLNQISVRHSPRKSSIKQGSKQFKVPRPSKAARQSHCPSTMEIKTLNNGSPDPKASKKYSLTQSTANKTLMKPKQIESILDSEQNQQDNFSEVILDMNRIEDFSQVEKMTTQEALKTLFMKGTMMGTNATESCNLSNKQIQ